MRDKRTELQEPLQWVSLNDNFLTCVGLKLRLLFRVLRRM